MKHKAPVPSGLDKLERSLHDKQPQRGAHFAALLQAGAVRDLGHTGIELQVHSQTGIRPLHNLDEMGGIPNFRSTGHSTSRGIES